MLSDLLFADDLVLMCETIKQLSNNCRIVVTLLTLFP